MSIELTDYARSFVCVSATLLRVIHRRAPHNLPTCIVLPPHHNRYRPYVIFHLPQLKVLDGSGITSAEYYDAKDKFAGKVRLIDCVGARACATWVVVCVWCRCRLVGGKSAVAPTVIRGPKFERTQQQKRVVLFLLLLCDHRFAASVVRALSLSGDGGFPGGNRGA